MKRQAKFANDFSVLTFSFLKQERVTHNACCAYAFLAISLLPILFAKEAQATTYQCSPQQMFTWDHGTLQAVPQEKLKEVYRFNDETGVLWLATSPSVPFTPTHFQILQKMSPDYDLAAISTSVVNGHFDGSETLIIRPWDKAAGLIYFLTGSEWVSSGRCEISPATTGERRYK